MNQDEKLRLGVIGTGRIGKVHAEIIAWRTPGALLAAVADVISEVAGETARQFHVPFVTADYREILTKADIDAVVICSATDTHAQIIQDAAAAGKHIFCEKPIDLTLQKTDEALAAVEKAGVKLQIGFNRRFDANFRQVRRMIVEGKIGRPHLLHITSRDPAPPPIEYIKVSGGLFLDMAIHDFDMARYLMGSEIEEVFASAGVLVEPEIGRAGDVDTAVITLKFANGAIGTINNSRQAVYGYDQRVEVFGSAGMVAVANNTPNTHVYSNAEGVHMEKPLYFFLERYMDSYAAEMQAFVHAVLHDEEPPVKGIDGRISILVGLAAKRSLAENRPVRIETN